MNTLRTVAAGTPLFWVIMGAGVGALLAQTLLLAAAVRRRSLQRRLRLAAEVGQWESVGQVRVPRPYLEVVALAALLLVPIATVAAVESARDMVRASLAEPDVVARASLLSLGWKGQLGAVSLGIVLEELAGGLGVIAWSLAFSSRKQIASLVHGARIATLDPKGAAAWARFPSPETDTVVACAGAIAALGFLPALHGAFSYCALLIKRMPSLGAVAPAEKLRQMDALLVEARRALESGLAASKLGLVLAAVTCVALLVWRSPARARRQWLGRPERAGSDALAGRSGATATWGTFACLLVSATLYFVSRPLQAENEMPWPPVEPHGERVPSTLRTPDVVGPDRLRHAPVLEVTPTAVRLDGKDVDEEGCRSGLDALRTSHGGHAAGDLHAGDLHEGDLIVVCEEHTPARRLNPFLAAAGASGFRRPLFAFVGSETHRRPALGTLTRARTTAAETRLEEAPSSGGEAGPTTDATVLNPEDFGVCDDLAARVVELRRGGRDVGLALPARL